MRRFRDDANLTVWLTELATSWASLVLGLSGELAAVVPPSASGTCPGIRLLICLESGARRGFVAGLLLLSGNPRLALGWVSSVRGLTWSAGCVWINEDGENLGALTLPTGLSEVL